jgi:hypothetical protein
LNNLTFEAVNPAVIGGSIAFFMFFGILLCLRFGRLIGQRAIANNKQPSERSLGSLESAVFALLGLLIAFTFSGAITRFDVRRNQVVSEANAIGTAYLRIDLLPASAQPPLRESFRNYVDARLATYQKLPDMAAARSELARSRQLQGDIWAQALAGTRAADNRQSAEMLLLPAINEMFDIQTTRVAATQIHPPTIIFAMLIGLALAGALLAGYEAAALGGYSVLHKIGFAGIVAFTVYVILDIEYPRLGFIRIDAMDKVLMDVRAGMGDPAMNISRNPAIVPQ